MWTHVCPHSSIHWMDLLSALTGIEDLLSAKSSRDAGDAAKCQS